MYMYTVWISKLGLFAGCDEFIIWAVGAVLEYKSSYFSTVVPTHNSQRLLLVQVPFNSQQILIPESSLEL